MIRVKLNPFLEKDLNVVFEGRQIKFTPNEEVEIVDELYAFIKDQTFIVAKEKVTGAKNSGIDYAEYSTKACCGRPPVVEIVMKSILIV